MSNRGNVADTIFTSCERSTNARKRAIEVAKSEGFDAHSATYIGAPLRKQGSLCNNECGQVYRMNDQYGSLLIYVSVMYR